MTDPRTEQSDFSPSLDAQIYAVRLASRWLNKSTIAEGLRAALATLKAVKAERERGAQAVADVVGALSGRAS